MRTKEDRAIGVVEDAIGGMSGYARRRATLAMEEVRRLAFGYANAILAGAVTERCVPENLLDHVRALIGMCGVRAEVSDADYTSAVVRRCMGQIRDMEEGR